MKRLSIEDPKDPAAIQEAADALRAGGLAVLPTETVYGLAADPRSPAAVRALAALKGRPADQPFTHHLASIEGIAGLAAEPPRRIRAWLSRVWPGPLTLILPAAEGDGDVGLRVPAHPFTQAVIAQLGHSLFMTSVNKTGEPPISDPDAIERTFAGEAAIRLLADAGPPTLGEASAVARLRGRKLEVLRPGILDERELQTGAAAKVLFVCTGNTCRSPLAVVLAERLVAARLGIETSEVLAHGLLFLSAGTGTLSGMPASAGSLEAAKEAGLDLSAHRSSALSRPLVDAADRIFCMSPSHLHDLLRAAPDAADKAFLLSADEESVPDPFGGPVEVYRATRDAIERHLRTRLDELLAL